MNRPEPGIPRLRDAATLLPALALFLWMPPVITLFTGGSRLWGVPLVVVYLFGAWLALIAAAAWLAWKLAPPGEPQTPDGPDAAAPDATTTR